MVSSLNLEDDDVQYETYVFNLLKHSSYDIHHVL
jgi:hypothetical protein